MYRRNGEWTYQMSEGSSYFRKLVDSPRFKQDPLCNEYFARSDCLILKLCYIEEIMKSFDKIFTSRSWISNIEYQLFSLRLNSPQCALRVHCGHFDVISTRAIYLLHLTTHTHTRARAYICIYLDLSVSTYYKFRNEFLRDVSIGFHRTLRPHLASQQFYDLS